VRLALLFSFCPGIRNRQSLAVHLRIESVPLQVVHSQGGLELVVKFNKAEVVSSGRELLGFLHKDSQRLIARPLTEDVSYFSLRGIAWKAFNVQCGRCIVRDVDEVSKDVVGKRRWIAKLSKRRETRVEWGEFWNHGRFGVIVGAKGWVRLRRCSGVIVVSSFSVIVAEVVA